VLGPAGALRSVYRVGKQPQTPGITATSTNPLVSSAIGAAGTTVINLAGELDVRTAGELRSAVTNALDEPDIRGLHIDLAGVTFCDSTGIGALVGARKAALEHSIDQVLVHPSRQMRRLLELTALDQAFTVR
jgi:anti-sigma B factor antagonist